MNPLVSLIVPCRNHNETLPALLRSVADQSIVSDTEILIVDDFSDVPCAKAPAAFPDLKIRILRTSERVYVKEARILGMEAARGEVIAFADADDTLWGTQALERNARFLLEQGADIAHFPCVEVNPDYRYVRECVAGRPLAPVLEGKAIFSALVRQGVRACTVWSKMYSRRLALEVLEAARPMPIRNGREDVMYNLLFFLHARKYVASPHTGYGWRVEYKDQAKAWRRASSCWYMLRDLLPYLETHGATPREAALLQGGLRRFLRKQMRLFCKGVMNDYPRLSDAKLENLLEDADFQSAAHVWTENF
ncbi:MAG: glycosyltransferase family 2 protein, partial [Desulfovibrio sp.]|nr:glycosyltransferase family 2 protein [Desulfovibrio sp.]